MRSKFRRFTKALFIDMHRSCSSVNVQSEQIQVLSYMVTIGVNACRPLCDLISKQYNFYPKWCTATVGREIVKCSLLGPFMAFTVFAMSSANRIFAQEFRLTAKFSNQIFDVFKLILVDRG